MKKLLFLSVFLLSFGSKAQSLCFVSADYQNAENFILFWERPDLLTFDSVFIYKRMPLQTTVFTKIAGLSNLTDPTFFEDTTAVTYKVTDYAISYKDFGGTETVLSYYHRPVILDYQDQLLVWTMYEKENVTGDAWILGYTCMRDQFGLGAYTSMGNWQAGGTNGSWFDEDAATTQGMTYQMQMDMPDCYVEGRANINTSRSNIKNQFSNAEVGVEEQSAIVITLAPNPVVDQISVSMEQKFVGSEFIVSDLSGRIIQKGKITSKELAVDMASQQNGNYLFTVVFEGKMHSKIFLKN